MTARIQADWGSVDRHLAALQAAPEIIGAELTGMFEVVYEGVRARVHVEDGYLKETGRASSGADGETWKAEMSFARNPGIFELARGGTHFFFDGVGDSLEILGTGIIRDGLEHA